MSKILKLGSLYSGRILSGSFLGVALGAFVATYGPHTLFLDQYAGLFQMYKKGFELEVTEDLKNMLSDAATNLGIPIIDPPTKLFHIIGYDTSHFGSTMTVEGVRIGLPISFQCKSISDIDKHSIQIDGKGVPWDSQDGEQLLDSLLMSDMAKMFGIAYELALADTHKLVLHTACCPVTLFVCLQINSFFCDALALPFRPTPVKVVFYIMLLVFGTGVFFLLKDLITQYCETTANRRVADASQQYVKGGIEFYEKTLQRNRALRNLLKSGTSEFNTIGDSTSLFRHKHVAISVKKRELQQHLLPTEDL